MKIKFILIIGSLLMVAFLLSNSMVRAESNIDLASPEAINKQLKTNILLMELDLKNKGTDVKLELEKLKLMFEQKKQETSSSIIEIIDTNKNSIFFFI